MTLARPTAAAPSRSSRPTLVLGIDPGTAVTGYGVVGFDARARPTLVECGVLRTRADDPLHARLRTLHEGVAELIARHGPDTLAVEDVFYARNVRTTVVLGHARGVILLAGATALLDVREYPPAEIKKAITGNGNATKEQVAFMVTRLLRLKHAPQPADAADGVAAALTACLATTLPALPPMPALRLPAVTATPETSRPAMRRTR